MHNKTLLVPSLLYDNTLPYIANTSIQAPHNYCTPCLTFGGYLFQLLLLP